jgi:hypothetical protein
VNYPPVIAQYRHIDLTSAIAQHSYSDIGYRYIAVRLCSLEGIRLTQQLPGRAVH